jgi:nitrite reductase/ring-hydroxylating ferredoxin subunit
MSEGTAITTVTEVQENRSYLFSAFDPRGQETEIVLLPCEDGVEAWINRCTHEAQRLATERGAAIRDGEVICPKHGSMFDTCSGYCDNGEAAETTLVDVATSIDEDGTVRLVDPQYDFASPGPIDDADDEGSGGPSSSSHLQF